MLLRSTQGGCRYVTCSSSIRVQMKHRASRRTQEATHNFRARHCCAPIAPRYIQTLGILDSLLARNWKSSSCMCEDCCLLLYLDMSTYEYSTGAAGAAVPIELYHTTPPCSSRASSPVTHAFAVVLSRRTVRLLRCACFCSFCNFFVAFFAYSLCCCTLGCTYSMHSPQQHLRGLLESAYS